MNKLAILGLARRLGLFALSRRFTGKALRILCYHGVWIGDGHFGDRLYMSAPEFAARMQALARSGYPVLGLDEALRRFEDGSLPPCATVITIDDGWHSSYGHMFPVLAQEQLPATLYVTSYYADKQTPVFDVAVRYMLERAPQRSLSSADIDSRLLPGDAERYDLDDEHQRAQAAARIGTHAEQQLDNDQRGALCEALGDALGVDYRDIVARKIFHIMSTQELAEVAEQGFDIQLHTHRHRITHEGRSCLTAEIETNRSWLEPFRRVPLRHFCYPSGLYERECWPELRELEVTSATTTEPGINFPGAEPFALRRILDGESSEWIEIEAELSGFVELTRRARSFVRRVAGR